MYTASIKSGHRGYSFILLQIEDDVTSICLCFQTSQTPFCRRKGGSRAGQRTANKGYMKRGGCLQFYKDFFFSSFFRLSLSYQSDAEFCVGK